MKKVDLTSSSTSSYEVATIKFDLGPIRDKLNSLYNDRHEARRVGDHESERILDIMIEALLREYDRSESLRAFNPLWRQSVMRAGWHNAKGDPEGSLSYDLKGWEYACDSADKLHSGTVARMKSISASNIADAMLRLNRCKDAVPWARTSVELWRKNPINYLVLAIVLYRSGQTVESEQIFDELKTITLQDDRLTTLTACISYEQELEGMPSPVVQSLLADAHAMIAN